MHLGPWGSAERVSLGCSLYEIFWSLDCMSLLSKCPATSPVESAYFCFGSGKALRLLWDTHVGHASVAIALNPGNSSTHHANPACKVDLRLCFLTKLSCSSVDPKPCPEHELFCLCLLPLLRWLQTPNLCLNRKLAQISTSVSGWLGVFLTSEHSWKQCSAHWNPCSQSSPSVKPVLARPSL